MIYLVALLACFALTFALVPLVKKIAFKIGAVDKPQKESRKIHVKPMATGGGIAIYIAFLITTFILLPEHNLQYIGLVIAGTIVLIVGLVDDIMGLNAWLKLGVQILAAVIVFIFFGIKIEAVSNPWGQSIVFTDPNLTFNILRHSISINLTSLFMTVFWLVAMTNTINIIDGIDGLSGGVSAIAAIIMFFLAISPEVHQSQVAIISIALAGGCLGYLIYNFHPAKIFNGDSGAYFLGMSLGIIAIFSGAKLATAALVLGVPILDVAWSVMRRVASGRSPFSADRGHLHYLLLDVGLTQKQSALLIYLLCAIFGVIALIASPTQKIIAVFAMAVVIVLLFLLLTLLRRRKS